MKGTAASRECSGLATCRTIPVVGDARTAWAGMGPVDSASWRLALGIARAEARAGNAGQAQIIEWSVLDALLSGAIALGQMPQVVSTLMPEQN
jgi:hypothetical protein